MRTLPRREDRAPIEALLKKARRPLALVGVGVQTQQRDSSRRICRGRGRILKGLAPCGQRAEPILIAGFSIEEAPRGRVVKALNHGIANFAGCFEVAQVSGGLVGIQRSGNHVGVVIEHAWDMAYFSFRVRVGNHMPQSLFGIPGLRQHAVQRLQGEVACRFELKHLGRAQVSRDTQRVPVYVDCLINVWRGPLQPRRGAAHGENGCRRACQGARPAQS